jgi:hypothetical protein
MSKWGLAHFLLDFRTMDDVWFKPFVWTDYRLALAFTVIIPAILTVWSIFQRFEAIQRLLIIYWRVASLVMIGIYLLIPSWSLGLLAGFAARILIPIALWFWVDINDEIRDLPSFLLKLLLTSWRWAVTIYCSIGAIAFLPFLPCAFNAKAIETPFCQVWFEAPWSYKALLHDGSTQGFMGFLGIVGLIIYVLYFAYFLFIRLGRQGRIALER